MTTADIRKLANSDLESRIIQLKLDLFFLRLEHATGQLAKTHRISEIRKTIAQMMTILNERKAGLKK
ncbi:MAG: 50S ribosomal protein L29 [Acholeplasmatales bacterium]|jgi:large subunit ribosomal protein L29|nr:50S ribosomal protein L29 [Acholeplasmatales bacterium]